jgi:hypothetical protein
VAMMPHPSGNNNRLTEGRHPLATSGITHC